MALHKEYDLIDGTGARVRVRVVKSNGGGWSTLDDGRIVNDKALALPPDDPDYCDRCGGPH